MKSGFEDRIKKLAQNLPNVVANGQTCPRPDYNMPIQVPPSGHALPCMGDAKRDKCDYFDGLATSYASKTGDIDKDRQVAGVKCKYK
jgi:hypothetical protein